MPRVGRPLRLRQPTNPQPPPQDEPVSEGPIQFFDITARDHDERPNVQQPTAPQIFDLSIRDDDPQREATIDIEATAMIDVEDSTEQLIINLRKDIELKNATIRHLQNALEAKSMTIGILTRAARDGTAGGCQQLVAELQAKTAAALLEKDELIADLRTELDDALRLACVFGATAMVQPSPPMHSATASGAHGLQDQQGQQQVSTAINRRRAPWMPRMTRVMSMANPSRAFSAIRSMWPSSLQLRTQQAARLQNGGRADKRLASWRETGMHQAEIGAAVDTMPEAMQAPLQKKEKAHKSMALRTSKSWLQPITTCWAGLGQPCFRTSLVDLAGKGAAEYRRPAAGHS